MRFAYTYRSSDGQRHTAEIEAESRDAAFAKVRAELGIKPIRVTAAGEGPRDNQGSQGRRRIPVPGVSVVPVVSALLALSALLAFGAWWWLTGRAGARDGAPYQVMTPQGPVTYSVAAPLPRQAIPGNRQRIEQAIGGPDRRQDGGYPSEAGQGVFAHAAERWLARYAEPGRWSKGEEGLARTRSGASKRPAPADFEAALREPIRIASTDFTEVVDLKRIVAGMKREMKAYLAGGGTAEQYLAELEKRQRLEISYRERAEQRLAELLAARPEAAPGQAGDRRQDGGSPYGRNELRPSQPGGPGPDGRPAAGQDRLKAAYAYWLKANAQLQAMGIYPLALPDPLRAYQMGLDIEE